MTRESSLLILIRKAPSTQTSAWLIIKMAASHTPSYTSSNSKCQNTNWIHQRCCMIIWEMPTGKKNSQNWQVFYFFFFFFFFSVTTLLTKLKRSQIGLELTKPTFEQLNKSCLERKLPVDSWKSDEAIAMEEQGEHLTIFDLDHKKHHHLLRLLSSSQIAKNTQVTHIGKLHCTDAFVM